MIISRGQPGIIGYAPGRGRAQELLTTCRQPGSVVHVQHLALGQRPFFRPHTAAWKSTQVSGRSLERQVIQKHYPNAFRETA